MLKSILLASFFFIASMGHSQVELDTTNLWLKKPTVSLSGFVDVYYFYDFNQPKTGYRQPFLYNHNRHNEFNLNLGIVKVAVENPKYRANLGLHAGTYVQDNYASEQNLLKHVSEANIGFSISKKNKLWFDVGILPSHIGFESAISMDNWTLTRSILAENSPYFMAGAKMTYKPTDKWELSGMALNGWQRIQRVSGNSMLSYGTQIKYSNAKNVTINWSTFIGTDDPDSLRRMRYFNNFFGQFQLTKKFGLITGFDVGFQQFSKNNTIYKTWWSPVIIGQFIFNDKWKTAIRAEYYSDPDKALIGSPSLNGFNTFGASLNIDYSPAPFLAMRLEGRLLQSPDALFLKDNSFSQSNFVFGASVAVKILSKQ